MSDAISTTAQQAYYDLPELGTLRAKAGKKLDGDTIKAVAAQFESLFVGMLIKSMRATTMGDPLLGGSGETLYREMSDQQLALSLSKQGGLGLGKVLAEYMRKQMPQEGGGEQVEINKAGQKKVSLQAPGIIKVHRDLPAGQPPPVMDKKKDNAPNSAQNNTNASNTNCHCQCGEKNIDLFIENLIVEKC
ncbi:MAG: rod-binding protein [Pseudomonadota bacterium]